MNIKIIIDKIASRKLGVTAVAGDVAATGVVEVTWPIAAIAMAYIAGQTVVDTGGECGAAEEKEKRMVVRAAPLFFEPHKNLIPIFT